MTGDKLMETSLCQQTMALLWKNLLLKWRRKWHSFLELMQNLLFVFLMFIITVVVTQDTLREENISPSDALGRLDAVNSTNFTIGYLQTSFPIIRDVMQKVARTVIIPDLKVQEYTNEKQLLEDVANGSLVGVIFDDKFNYHIRYHVNKITRPNDYFSVMGFCLHDLENCHPTRYWNSGFLSLQASIDSAVIEVTTNHSVWKNMASMVAVKMKSVVHMFRFNINAGTFFLAIPMCYVSLTYLLSLYVTRERREIREIMKIMRLRDLAFWLSWGLLYIGYVLILANLMTLVTKYVFVESSYGLILLLFFLYGIASICFTFMLSALFRNPRVTAIAGFFITLFLSALSLLLSMKDLPKAIEVLFSIFPPFAFSVGITQSFYMESDFQGVYFADMTGDSSHMMFSCIILVVDSIFYMTIALYFDKILPDKHGMKYEPLFFLKSSYWRRNKMVPVRIENEGSDESTSGEFVEKVPADLLGKQAIRINKVKKTYSGCDKKVEALRGLDLDVYEGQITALLGHSGAGKTTLLNILSGMCSSSSGSAIVYNYKVSDMGDLEEIKKRAGFCPQFDVKFDPLTVMENLRVFARIKGIPSNEVEKEVKKVISDLQMNDIENIEADKLSGGQKRKLTLGIAILGDPQVLLLDEPSAGLDPCSRHHIWTILKERKANRVTLFSTQFMDEADILADRKAVISNGRLKCVGSSLFLKRKWGIGYHLRMQVPSSCDTELMTSIIKQHISSSKLTAQNEEELTYTLPFENMDSFPDLFLHLDGQVGQTIVNYGVSMTTLDDVFLKLEGEAEIEQGDYGVFSQEPGMTEDKDWFSAEMDESLLLMSDSGNVTLSGWALWRQQVLAVARTRFLKFRHDTKSFRSVALLVALFMIQLIMFTIVVNTFHMKQSWELKPNLYFQSPGDRVHKYYTTLPVYNNTGSSIEDFVGAVEAQNIVVDVINGKYNTDIMTPRGAIEVSRGEKGYNFIIVGNPKAHNALPVLLNIISNAILKIFKSTENIRVWNNPVLEHLDQDYNSVSFAFIFFVIFASGLSPHFAMSSIEDNRIKTRSQLRISGLFPSAYWLGQALVDVLLYWFLLFLMICMLFAFNHSFILGFSKVMVLITGILGYGTEMVLYVYIISFIFGKGKSHHDSWSLLFVISAFIPIFLDGVISSFPFMWYYFVMPASTLTGFMSAAVSDIEILTSRRKTKVNKNPEELENVDDEVLAERERVKRSATTTNPEEKPIIIVDSLRKEFKVKKGGSIFKKRRKAATKNISFCVKKGEVLGLLGPNGAGKTTSIYMLAGEVIPTAGEVVLCEIGAAESQNTAYSTGFLGYCPQDNPLWPNLTVKQHLEIYAAVKGMKKEDADIAIKRVVEALELKEHQEKSARKLSAGVSRKVCFAISMLGNPNIVLLDEPSTGMDPKGQQRMWRAIRAAFKNKGRGAILTTHYMEEAEAVCDRVAIMVSGKLRCIGSIQQLKSKFGKGYLLELKLKDSLQVDLIHNEIIRIFPHAARQDRFSSLLVYKIPMDNVHSLSQAFLLLEEAKQAYNIEEYNFSQSTLEQVFIELTKEQEKEDFDLNNTFQWKHLRTESI
ncbi:ATP-binding cassette sub-family A member 9-like [Rhinophrynus dorsalis]